MAARLQLLPAYLEHPSLLQARLVCTTWRSAFSSSINQLQLVQPMSAATARKLARKAAAAFPYTSLLRIDLYHEAIVEFSFDLTADENNPTCLTTGKLERPNAAAALLRQFSKTISLQELQLQLQHIGRFTGVPKMLLLAPQLCTLDLSGCHHESADLLVIAQHLQQLQTLLLNCPAFTTLSGAKKRSGNWGDWVKIGGGTCYEPQHIAALANLPQLRHLECPVPTGVAPKQLEGTTEYVHRGAHPWAEICESRRLYYSSSSISSRVVMPAVCGTGPLTDCLSGWRYDWLVGEVVAQ
jgi:hypothetical protein